MRWSVQNELPVQQGGSTGWERRCESRGQEGGEAGNCSPGLSSWLWNHCSLGAAQSSEITQGAEGAVPHSKSAFHSDTGWHVPCRAVGKGQGEEQPCKHHSGSGKITCWKQNNGSGCREKGPSLHSLA